ncbi:tyrosine-type recombinase/integrase [Candidatus Woesebacteria bacterium]|nr:tyrosine-type recombinase/integrase [Candidatus Woesebacteria bacterium]
MKALKDQFIKYLQKEGRASATILAYAKDLDQLIEFLADKGVTTVTDIITDNLEEFKQFLKDNKYTLKSISRKLNSIKSFFKYLIGEGIVTSSPAGGVSHPKYEITPPRILSPLEYRALRDAVKDDVRMYGIVELLLQTGLRIGELAAIQLQDISIEKNNVKIRAYESHEARKVPLNGTAINAIEKYVASRPKTKNTTLFVTKTGNPFLIRNIRTAVNRYFRIAGIENAKVNDLRHTFVVEQLKAGVPIVELSHMVGHKRLSTTEKYLEFIGGTLSEPKKIKIAEL